MKEWITGRNPVYEVLKANRRQFFRLLLATGLEEKARLQEITRLAGERRLKVERVPRQQLDALANGPESHQGVALQASGYMYSDVPAIIAAAEKLGEPLFVLALDALQNPQNVGTLLRTAGAVGVHGVIIPLAHTATITPAAIHASAGVAEHLRVAQVNLAQALTTFKQAGAWVIGLEGGPDSQPVEQTRLDGPLVLVVGSEGEGMRLLVSRSCDLRIRLPMSPTVESLNAAVAGSVALYLALLARRKA
ncbi:MAG TPA: 23S rRNA (guanosine(2251)-2'-O)-methyltransferase RlmB [Anaerolineaceae bacterium]|nr:23S rRNA (guanosine(2251)-2'-O)-methyltransferase RlmB [Anaerolineaceae bacterium]